MGDKSWQKKKDDSAYSFSAYGGNDNNGSYTHERKDAYESDAKMLAGKEKREMEAMFGKKSSTSSAASTSKAFEPAKASPGKMPSMFSGGSTGGTLMSSGSSSTMKTTGSSYDSVAGGAKAAGRPLSGGVSKMNMGSLGVMDTSRSSTVSESNRANFAGGSSSNGSVSRMNMGSAGIMDTSRSATVSEANRAKFATTTSSRPVDSGVSKMSMGSYGVMDQSKSKPVTEANRGSFGTQKTSPGAYKGATTTESRDPNSQKGVLRKFAWET